MKLPIASIPSSLRRRFYVGRSRQKLDCLRHLYTTTMAPHPNLLAAYRCWRAPSSPGRSRSRMFSSKIQRHNSSLAFTQRRMSKSRFGRIRPTISTQSLSSCRALGLVGCSRRWTKPSLPTARRSPGCARRCMRHGSRPMTT